MRCHSVYLKHGIFKKKNLKLSKTTKGSLLARWSGGRGVVVGPILSESRSDVFCDNENGPNFLFKNNGNGAFVDMATQAGENEVVREHEA